MTPTSFKDQRGKVLNRLCKAFSICVLQALLFAKLHEMGQEWPGRGRSKSQSITGKHLDVNQKELVRELGPERPVF